MVDQEAFDDNATTTTSHSSREVNTTANLARLRNNGKPLTPQELKELNARIKAFEEMARMEDRLRALESRKRPRSQGSPEFPEDTIAPPRLSEAPLPSRSSLGHRQTHVRPSIEIDSSSSNSSTSSTITYHRHKRQRLTRGIKITPSYTLKVSSSLREWGDWKKDIERVFEGDPYMYQKGSQKILKALDYLDSNLKSL